MNTKKPWIIDYRGAMVRLVRCDRVRMPTLVDRSVRVPSLDGCLRAGTKGIVVAGIDSVVDADVDEEEDDANDLTSGGGEFVGVDSKRFSASEASPSWSTRESTIVPSSAEDSASPSGRGRCSARNVSLPTEDTPFDLKRWMRKSRSFVGGRSSTTRRGRLRGVVPVGLSSLVPSSARLCVVRRMFPRAVVAATLRASTAVDMLEVSERMRLDEPSIDLDVDAMPRCVKR